MGSRDMDGIMDAAGVSGAPLPTLCALPYCRTQLLREYAHERASDHVLAEELWVQANTAHVLHG